MAEKQFIIYGAGTRGRHVQDFFAGMGEQSKIYGFCDQKFTPQNSDPAEGEDRCFCYQEAKNLGIPFFIAIADPEIVAGVARMFEADGVTYFTDMHGLADYLGEDRTKFNRQMVAYAHTKGQGQDAYFGYNETPEWMALWWDKDGFIYPLFEKLDLSNVIELACGRGRHVPRYVDNAGQVTLVDIVEYNLQCCRERFQDNPKVHYYLNNGFNLEKLESGRYTALFSYDSVIHFELLDIWEYLKDIYRVLAPGGRVLIHHSNNDKDYRYTFETGYQGRAFMSKNIFAYLANRAGFEILEQVIFDCGGDAPKDTDCITLLEKPVA